MLIAQISDLHIRAPGQLVAGRVDTAAALVRCVERLAGLRPRPDMVLLTGDLVDTGEDAVAYEHLMRMLAPLRMPLCPIPGNHDGRRALRAAFRDSWAKVSNLHGEFVQYAVETDDFRVVCLDTLDPGRDGGVLDETRLAWLQACLADRPGVPVLLAMHHPPFATGIAFMDRIGCRAPATLARVLRDAPQVRAITCGHVHRFALGSLAGTPACTAPSTAHQIHLDLDGTDDDAGAFVMEPPGLLLHLWRPEAGLATHYCPMEQAAGPYRFDD